MLVVRTEREPYYVNEETGEIGRRDSMPSGQWKLVGAREYNNFGYCVARYSLNDIIEGAVPWRWKNGKARCYIVDWDHGTFREWRQTVIEAKISNHAFYCRRCRTIQFDEWCSKCKDVARKV